MGVELDKKEKKARARGELRAHHTDYVSNTPLERKPAPKNATQLRVAFSKRKRHRKNAGPKEALEKIDFGFFVFVFDLHWHVDCLIIGF